jgi:hypothetical protein
MPLWRRGGMATCRWLASGGRQNEFATDPNLGPVDDISRVNGSNPLLGLASQISQNGCEEDESRRAR